MSWVTVIWSMVASVCLTLAFFLGIVAAMAYEMSGDVRRAAQLSDDLRESEERMSLATEAGGIGIWMWSLARNRRQPSVSTLDVLQCYVIRTLADETTSDIWNGVNSKAARRIPRGLWASVRRKLDQIDAVSRLEDLRVPPDNRLHALVGDLAGCHVIRVNDQYRVVFRFEGHDAYDVRCTDYH